MSRVHRSIRRLQWLSLFVILLIIGGGMALALSEISGAVVAHAVVVVDTNRKKVQHLDGGIVAEILTRNGQRVKAGDTLIRLDGTELRAVTSILGAQLQEILARRSRLIAERDLLDLTIPQEILQGDDPVKVKVWQEQQQLLEARRTARTSKKQQLAERIDQLKKVIEGANAQAESKTQQSALIKRELAALQGLAERQLVTQTRVLALEREAAKLEGDRVQFLSEASKTAVQIGETRLQLLEIEQAFLSEVLEELRDVELRVVELTERQTAASARLKRTTIIATQSGYVDQLSVHTIGGVIGAGETLVEITPEDDLLIFEGRIDPTQIDRAHVGQDVTIRLTTLDRRTTPELLGSVKLTSADSWQDAPQNPPYFVVRVMLKEGELAKLGQVKLRPGMPAELFIQTDQRSILSYLLKPLVDQISHAFRE